MTTVTPKVLALDGDQVITGHGTQLDAPDRTAPRPAAIFDRLTATLGTNGQVLITGKPGWESLTDPDASGSWILAGGPVWWTVRSGSRILRIGKIPGISPDNDPLIRDNPDLITITVRHQMFADLTGITFYGDGGTTSAILLDQTMKIKGKPPLRKWVDPEAPDVREDAWPGGGSWETSQEDYHSQVTIDRNAQYLAAVNGNYVPLDAPKHTGADVDPGRVGLYRIRTPKNPEPRMPHPCGRNAQPGIAQWVAHPTMELLGQLGIVPEILDSWTADPERCRRALDPWYQVLRNARAALVDRTDMDSAAVMAAVKDTYSRGISHLDKSPDRRWFRPDWRNIFYASARTSMWRAIWRAGVMYGVWPVYMRADSVTYESPEAPKAFKIGTGMGEWKVTTI